MQPDPLGILKEADIRWRTWAGNLAEGVWVCDGFSAFHRDYADDKRLSKLEGQESMWGTAPTTLTLYTDDAEPLSIRALCASEELRDRWHYERDVPRQAFILEDGNGVPVLLNAGRLRCADLVVDSWDTLLRIRAGDKDLRAVALASNDGLFGHTIKGFIMETARYLLDTLRKHITYGEYV